MNNKTVLVTGSSRGIGKEIAKTFLSKNYNVVINSKNSDTELNNTLKQLKEISKNVISIKKDVSIYNNVKELFTEIHDTFGDVDILINNAGISYVGLFNKMKPEKWQEIINNNLNSVFNCTHIALQSMIRNHNGKIVNISSIWGNIGASCETVYSASKGAINSFTKALAKELGPCGIRINAIACGVIDTKMNNFLNDEEKDILKNEIPLMRFGTVNEVSDLVQYLVSDNSSYITGQIITLDGAMT